MRVIEAEGVVTSDGTLVIPAPVDLAPGSYHAVVVIDIAITLTEQPPSTLAGNSWKSLFRVMDEIAALPRTGLLSPLEDLVQGRR